MRDGIVNIRGKQYTTVEKRVRDFREAHPIDTGWAIVTTIVEYSEQHAVVLAQVNDPEGRCVASGYAEERKSGKGINSTSHLENCETSAIGRALAACGYGGTAYASANEVATAIARQEAQEAQEAQAKAKRWSEAEKRWFCAKLGEMDHAYDDVAAWCESLGRPRPSVMSAKKRSALLDALKDRGTAEKLSAFVESQASD